eukprot:TRINITY_DN1836_c0_g2_i1.p1 TRINITY_DN1836_c0_g2~~TRINITY_DN1836_c0_g2_i1.p1  ORF type:complete len:2740 (+),score=416.68 TRINITY_DN1836_c0_g2_i1:74-8293(+)
MKNHRGTESGSSDPLLSGVPPLTVLWQLCHLCWMQMRIRLREWDTFSEMVFPVIIVGVYCLLFSVVEESTSNDGGLDLYTAYRAPPLSNRPGDGVLRMNYPVTDVDGPLWFAVDTTSGSEYWQEHGRSVIESLIDVMLVEEGFIERHGTVRWFDDHTAMERILCTTEDETALPFAAVTFSQHSSLHKSCLTLGRRDIMTDSHFKNFTTGIHYTLHFNKIPSPSSSFSSVKPYVPSKTRTYAKALMRLQYSIDTAFYSCMYGDVKTVPVDITFRRFPPQTEIISMRLGNLSESGSTEKIRRMKARDQVFRRGGGPMLALSWIMTFSSAATASVRTRQLGSSACLTVLGLSPIAQGIATVISIMSTNIVTIGFQVCLLLETQALINVDWDLMVVYLSCFVLSVVAAGQLFASFFRNPEHTPVLSVIIYCVFVAAGASIAECDETSYGEEEGCLVDNKLTAASLISTVALILGFRQIVIIVNDEGRHVTWKNLHTGKAAAAGLTRSSNDDFTISTTLGMIVADAFLYFLLAWYISRVAHSGYRWYFPVSKSYWCSSTVEEAPPPIAEQDDFEPVVPQCSHEMDYVYAVRGLTASVAIEGCGKGKIPCFSYNRQRVLDDIDLDMHPGQVLAVVGASGKSALIRCLTGQLIPDSGRFYFRKKLIQPALYQYRMKIGLAPQRECLFERLTVYEHLKLVGVIKNTSRLQLKAQAESIALEVDLLSLRNRRVRDLTPGQKKKLQVAMALLGDSNLAFLDEPTLDMDPISTGKIRDLIRRYKHGKIIVITTSSVAEAELVGDRICMLQYGRLRCIGTSGFLKRRFGCGYHMTMTKQVRPWSPPNQHIKSSLIHKLRLLTPSAFLRESTVQVKAHLPLQNTPELVALLRVLEDPTHQIHTEIKKWSLKMNGLEDIYLRLEEVEYQATCTAGHNMIGIETATFCDGRKHSSGNKLENKLHCPLCDFTLCIPCSITGDYNERASSSESAQGPSPSFASESMVSPRASNMNISPRVAEPARLNHFWQDSDFNEFLGVGIEEPVTPNMVSDSKIHLYPLHSSDYPESARYSAPPSEPNDVGECPSSPAAVGVYYPPTVAGLSVKHLSGTTSTRAAENEGADDDGISSVSHDPTVPAISDQNAHDDDDDDDDEVEDEYDNHDADSKEGGEEEPAANVLPQSISTPTDPSTPDVHDHDDDDDDGDGNINDIPQSTEGIDVCVEYSTQNLSVKTSPELGELMIDSDLQTTHQVTTPPPPVPIPSLHLGALKRVDAGTPTAPKERCSSEISGAVQIETDSEAGSGDLYTAIEQKEITQPEENEIAAVFHNSPVGNEDLQADDDSEGGNYQAFDYARLPDIVFSTPAQTRVSDSAQLRMLVLKRYKMTRNNGRAFFCHFVLPLCFVVTGMLALELLPNDTTRYPSVSLQPSMIGPAVDDTTVIPVSGSFFREYEPIPPCIGCDDNVTATFEILPDDTDLGAILTPSQFGNIGASVRCNDTHAIIWYNASSVHALPAVWNLMVNSHMHHSFHTQGKNPLKFSGDNVTLSKMVHGLFHNDTLYIHTTVHAITLKGSKTESALPLLSFGFLVSVGMAFVSSGFAVAIVNEQNSGSRFLQQNAGVPTWLYWLGHYVWDTFMCFWLTTAVVMIFACVDPIYQNSSEFLALVLITFEYLQASLIVTYVCSHFFATAWKAQAGIAALFLMVMTVPLIMSVNLTDTEGTFITNFSNLTVFIFNPLYSLINAYLILTDYMDINLNESLNPFYLIRKPVYGLAIQAFGGILLLVLYEVKDPLIKKIKDQFPRPSGFYTDDLEQEDTAGDMYELQQGVKEESKKVERLWSSGRSQCREGIVIHQLRKVYKGWRDRVMAVRSLDLIIEPGETFALLGPSGAGKTTTTGMLVGMTHPSQGSALVNGHNILTEFKTIRRMTGTCLQKNALIKELTVMEHVVMYATLAGIKEKTILPYAEEMMKCLGLHQYRHCQVGRLSTSTSRGLSLLIAFIGRPPILILDEPTAGMDLVSKKRAQQFLLLWMKQARSKGIKPTVILTSHSIEEAQMLSNRLGILVKGRLKCLGSLQTLSSKFGKGWSLAVRTPNDQHSQAFTSFLHEMIPGARVTSGRYGSVVYHLPDSTETHKLLEQIEANRESYQVSDYSLSQLSLEEVFLKTVLGEISLKMQSKIPSLEICMLVVGTRGDVQPLLAFALGLASKGHHVRLATHKKFKDFVEEEVRVRNPSPGSVSFFPLAGEPDKLMSFMVENPDLVTINTEKIRANQEMMFDIFKSCWSACTTPKSYVPDVLIANPPVHCHVHIAERLQCHLQILFTMPWSTTAMYPHPFAATDKFGNEESYTLVEKMIWMGLGQKISEFRSDILRLPVGVKRMNLSRMMIPHVYCFSEHMIERPSDWGPHISMTGNWILEPIGHYTPAAELKQFLDQNKNPIYFGFGSIVLKVSEGRNFLRAINKAISELLAKDETASVIFQGRHDNFGQKIELDQHPRLLFYSEDVDHSWLFPQCKIVVHHGGAGTVASGLRAGCPTVVIPFFGDQPFWGKVIERLNFGACILNRDITKKSLLNALNRCSSEYVQYCVKEASRKLNDENGVAKGIDAFYSQLPLTELPDCDVCAWEECCYENQRYYPILGWSDTLLPGDPPAWSDNSGFLAFDKFGFNVPPGWVWVGEWEVDKTSWQSENNGFLYASSWNKFFHKRQKWSDFVRKRRWVRKRAKQRDNVDTKARLLRVEIETLQKQLSARELEMKTLCEITPTN